MVRRTLAATAQVLVGDMIGVLEEEICSRCIDCMGDCPCQGDTGDDACHEKGRFDDLDQVAETIQRLIGHIM